MKRLNPVFLMFLFMFASPAWADRPAYCAAYARDFADSLTRDKVVWKHKYDIAQQSCLGEAKAAVATPLVTLAEQPKKKIKAKTVVASAPAAELPAAELPAPAKAAKSARLEPGSDDWKTFCANKYTSFNPDTGTYLSRTGVKRKCLALVN